MVPKAAEVRLTPEDRQVLEVRLRAPTSEQRDVLRTRIVLLADAGGSTRSIAKAVAVMPRTVSLWRGRYAREGLAGLADKPRPGPGGSGSSSAGRVRALDRSAESPPNWVMSISSRSGGQQVLVRDWSGPKAI
jgi:hypothetical protein